MQNYSGKMVVMRPFLTPFDIILEWFFSSYQIGFIFLTFLEVVFNRFLCFYKEVWNLYNYSVSKLQKCLI